MKLLNTLMLKNKRFSNILSNFMKRIVQIVKLLIRNKDTNILCWIHKRLLGEGRKSNRITIFISTGGKICILPLYKTCRFSWCFLLQWVKFKFKQSKSSNYQRLDGGGGGGMRCYITVKLEAVYLKSRFVETSI